MAFLSELCRRRLKIPTAFLFATLLYLFYAQSINFSCDDACNAVLLRLGTISQRHAAGNATAATVVSNSDAAVGTKQQQTGAEEPESYAMKYMKEQLRLIRSWAPPKGTNSTPTCDGGGIFVYDLPAKFNKDILSWLSSDRHSTLRDYFQHGGLGLPIPELAGSAYQTHQLAVEPIFHARVLNHRCRVRDPAAAALFYVPFYAGLHVMMSHMVHATYEVKDGIGKQMVEWLEGQRWWRRRRGADHMFVLGMITWDLRRHGNETWGTNFLSLAQMSAPYRFLMERHPWEAKDIGVPYPSYFHPHGDADVTRWQERVLRSGRETLVAFAGGDRPNDAKSIRSTLIRQCKSAGKSCEFLDCAGNQCKVASVVRLMLRSEFCLQPPGDSPTRRSVFDSLASGCIPVLFTPFSAEYQYPWHLPEGHEKYSVLVAEEEVRKGRADVVQTLRDVSPEKKEEMRRYIVQELMPRLAYGDSTAKFEKFQDAIDITMNSILHKVKTYGY